MSKLTRKQSQLHAEACALLRKDELSYDERWFVLEHWHEGAGHNQTSAGAFFTPLAYANTFAIHTTGRRKIIDLCAGIGTLAHAARRRHPFEKDADFEITCVESNPQYVEVGKKILPYARWICADVMDLPSDIGCDYDIAISNPPFRQRAKARSPRYKRSQFVYKVIDIASDLAREGLFIVPQSLAQYHISGKQTFTEAPSHEYLQFHEMTGITLEANCGIDASVFKDDWHGASVMTEVVLADFEAAREARMSCVVGPLPHTLEPSPEQGVLFADAA